MNRMSKIAAAVAVLAVIVLGCSQVPAGQTGSAAPTRTPAPVTSPSAAPSVEASAAGTHQEAGAAPQPPVEFTGLIECGSFVRQATEETLDVDDGIVLARRRGAAYRQSVEMSDPRLEGTIYHTFEADTYILAGAAQGPEVAAWTHRIENREGAWESHVVSASAADGSSIGEPPEVLIGEGAYAGLIAIFEVTAELEPCDFEVRGIIFDGAPVPEPYIAE
jgi:hypothetical protein